MLKIIHNSRRIFFIGCSFVSLVLLSVWLYMLRSGQVARIPIKQRLSRYAEPVSQTQTYSFRGVACCYFSFFRHGSDSAPPRYVISEDQFHYSRAIFLYDLSQFNFFKKIIFLSVGENSVDSRCFESIGRRLSIHIVHCFEM